MPTKPLFSIIIPTLNEAKFIGNLLNSLLEQTDKDFEVIVVDGSSKDATVSTVRRYRDKFSDLQILSTPQGVSLQRNAGARIANGQYLLFIDADNTLMPYAIERMKVFTTRTHADFFACWFQADSEKPSESLYALIANVFIEGSIITKKNFAPGGFTAVTKTSFSSVGGYDQTRIYGEDIEFSQRMAKNGFPLHIIREVLFIWSLRRFRKEGTLKVAQIYAFTTLLTFLAKLNIKSIPGYVTGGHIYTNKFKPKKKSVISRIERNVKKLMSEFLS